MCLPKRTKTNICLASLGVKSIEYYIDRCKLYFLRRLCSTPIDSSVKKLFLHRLMAFKNSVTTLNVGLISDVTRILNKYKLNNFIENFISKSYIPPKTIWKHIVKRSLNHTFTLSWNQTVIDDSAHGRFVFIHINITEPLLLWKTASKYPRYIKQISFFVRLCAMTNVNGICELWNCKCVDFVEHFFL